ncbi:MULTISPECIES: hypothetical protein [unclassified Rhizobium]|uniref:hypothetical protein n=1 Tax=unclassified Rhizobium TaxID=2613769 RepID=UPI0017860278|nr:MULTISPECIES: hypothetical protein [unclassified Rhizobium]MBD8689148.1 hypothetical protein [Rhizobium sp. CFBP 13644]MBD8693616.1 hypothetical protein [Rhizobium sp. CFBP 13717]
MSDGSGENGCTTGTMIAHHNTDSKAALALGETERLRHQTVPIISTIFHRKLIQSPFSLRFDTLTCANHWQTGKT